MRCSSFHSIASCSFEFILMPESSSQECFMMLICWNCYNMLICHFCHVWCVHPMRLMSTCVLIYAMPFSRGVCHVFLWSMWWLAQACKLGFVMLLISVPVLLLFFMPCKLDATERSMLILRYFSKDVLYIWLWSIHSCPCLQLWSSLACHFLALLLL